jgi:hypothetical protein
MKNLKIHFFESSFEHLVLKRYLRREHVASLMEQRR